MDKDIIEQEKMNSIVKFCGQVIGDDKIVLENSDKFNEKLKLVLEENKDIEIFKNDNKSFILYGSLAEQLSKIDEMIILVYRVREISYGIEREYFGLIYFDPSYGVSVDYYISLDYCFSNQFIKENNPFSYSFLVVPEENIDNAGFVGLDRFCYPEDLFDENLYDLFIESMLKKTNSKVKNAIYKVF